MDCIFSYLLSLGCKLVPLCCCAACTYGASQYVANEAATELRTDREGGWFDCCSDDEATSASQNAAYTTHPTVVTTTIVPPTSSDILDAASQPGEHRH